ncbi:MAG: hypothetical protein JWO58_3105 [Chitinophagaceae bacterium]|nr:hypothetical protein [Chitinophagaceae bacterium]
MLEQLKNSISDIQSVGSIELQVDANGTTTIHWLILSKRKQVLVIEKSGTLTDGIDKLTTCIPASIPVVLSLSGKGVLHKKVQQQGDNKEKLFDYVFPNARISEYVVQYQLCSNNSFYVSVVRKDQVERLVNELSEQGYSVLSLSLGAFAIGPLLKAVPFSDNSLQAGRHQLSIDAGIPSEYSFTQTEDLSVLDIAGEQLPSMLLVPYAMAFQYMVKGIEKMEVVYPLFQQLQETYKEKRVFKTLSVGGLVFFFSVLVINTIAYSLLAEKNNRLSSEYGSAQNITVSNKKGREEFDRKESFLSQAGWLSPAAISYYTDRIASSLPDDIQLTSLSVYPFNEQKSRKDKKEIFESNSIVVKGTSSKPTDINRWTKELNSYTWVTQIKVQDYSFDHKTNTGSFSLHISISNELE